MISILNKFKLAAFLATGLIFLTLRIKEEMKTEKNKEYPHSDLNDKNLTLINITNFKFVINNACDILMYFQAPVVDSIFYIDMHADM